MLYWTLKFKLNETTVHFHFKVEDGRINAMSLFWDCIILRSGEMAVPITAADNLIMSYSILLMVCFYLWLMIWNIWGTAIIWPVCPLVNDSLISVSQCNYMPWWRKISLLNWPLPLSTNWIDMLVHSVFVVIFLDMVWQYDNIYDNVYLIVIYMVYLYWHVYTITSITW